VIAVTAVSRRDACHGDRDASSGTFRAHVVGGAMAPAHAGPVRAEEGGGSGEHVLAQSSRPADHAEHCPPFMF
jgi:hypothetical protein